MTAGLALDHVVIRVNDLERAVADYEALGFTVVPGGEHPGLGSRNALIAFADDSYLELIAFDAPAPPVQQSIPKSIRVKQLAAQGQSPPHRRHLSWELVPEGLVDFALVPKQLEQLLERARKTGLHLDGPIPGGRARPDGQRVAWQMAVPDHFDLPFLCADVTPRELRVPRQREHVNGVRGIRAIVVAVADLDSTPQRYRKLLGIEPLAVPRSPALDFVLGTATIRLLPAPNAFDEGPISLSLRGAPGTKVDNLDMSLTHHARIYVVDDKEPFRA
jgi:catechol 2,3-dioxygenase-like lactoylglutathione lyase family enzyme